MDMTACERNDHNYYLGASLKTEKKSTVAELEIHSLPVARVDDHTYIKQKPQYSFYEDDDFSSDDDADTASKNSHGNELKKNNLVVNRAKISIRPKIYIEQRDHAYLNKKQSQLLNQWQRDKQQSISNSRIVINNKKLSISTIRPPPVVDIKSTRVAFASADRVNKTDKKSDKAESNSCVLEEHGYGLNFAEEQQENIRRDHSYGYSSVPKGRRLSKIRKSIRANTQPSTLDHAYEQDNNGQI